MLQIAKIPVQNSFCNNCIPKISERIREVNEIEHIRLDPIEVMITFYFKKAHQLSEVLNTLTTLGYPPQGDIVTTKQEYKPICNCLDNK